MKNVNDYNQERNKKKIQGKKKYYKTPNGMNGREQNISSEERK